MQPVQLPGLTLGEGKASIIVPVMGSNASELAEAARALTGRAANLVEWRLDYLAGTSAPVVRGCAEVLRRETELPILATYRTRDQGGRGQGQDAKAVADAILSTGLVDLIDIEYESTSAREVAREAYAQGITPVLSLHDFTGTPSADAVLAGLAQMQDCLIGWFEAERGQLDPDSLPYPGLVKVAYMPVSLQDALNLASGARRFYDEFAKLPFIALSMGELGAFTRAFAGALGSAATFASAGQASAPGQIPLDALAAFSEAAHSLQLGER